jgi:hypothetical protein
VHRLTEWDDCNRSPACAERFSNAVRRAIQSDTPNERPEAVNWLIWIGSVSNGEKKREGYERGLPIPPDSALRILLDSAIDDRNVAIGDEAFQYREMFEMDRSGSPGECFVIVPALRKSAFYALKIPLRYLQGFHCLTLTVASRHRDRPGLQIPVLSNNNFPKHAADPSMPITVHGSMARFSGQFGVGARIDDRPPSFRR